MKIMFSARKLNHKCIPACYLVSVSSYLFYFVIYFGMFTQDALVNDRKVNLIQKLVVLNSIIIP